MRDFILFVLDNGSLLFLAAATVALILGIGLGAGMYWFREGGGPRRALKLIDLVAHIFSFAAVLAAMMPLYNLTSEFLLKIALHDTQTALEKKTLDNIRLTYHFCWTKQPEEIRQYCDKTIFPITDLMSGLNYENGQSIPHFMSLDVLHNDIKNSELQMNTEIDSYNSAVDQLKKHYKNENDEFRFYTIPLMMLAGAVAAFAIGLGLFRRCMELLIETG